MTETDQIAEAGVHLVGLRVTTKLKWIHRPQPISDQGIDAHIEVAENGRGNGDLLAAQIKTGDSYFREEGYGGWVFRFSATHHRLWTNHALPVVVLLVNLDEEAIYWQHVHESVIDEAGESYKLIVPRSNRLENAGEVWAHLASGNERRAEDRYDYNRLVLPPSVRQVFDKHFDPVTPHAAMVAMHLAAGRGNPKGTVEALLASRPLWVESNPWLWRAVGGYASEHGALEESSAAFEAAGEAFLAQTPPADEQAAMSFAAAGINVMSVDHDRARQLLERADSLGGAPVTTRLGFIMLDAAENDTDIELPAEFLDTTDEKLTSNELLQILAGNIHLNNGLRNDGVNRLEMALSAAPESSKAMSQLAHHLASRDHSAQRQNDDLPRAEALLIKAVEQRRQWAGPTADVLRELSRALALQKKPRDVLYWLQPPPRGTATPLEAADVELIRESLRAAYVSRDHDLTRELSAQLGDEPTDQLLRVRTQLLELPEDELVALLRNEAQAALDADDLQELAGHIHALADLGIDESHLLDQALAAGHVEQWLPDMFAGLAEATASNNQSLTKLKVAARTASMAAELLINRYVELGDLDAAINEAEAAQQRFHNTMFALTKADLLVKANRYDEAEQAASTALASTNQYPDSRQDLANFLIWRAQERGDWANAEAMAARNVEETNPPHPTAVWVLVETQVNAGHHLRSIETINRHNPTITTVKHARLWCHTHTTIPWTDEIVTKALDLLDQFPDEHNFAGQVLSHIIRTTKSAGDLAPDPEDPDSPPPPGLEPGPYQVTFISDALRARTFEKLNELTTEHAEESGIQVIEEPDDEVMVQKLIAMAQERAENRWTELPDLHARGRIGTGMLATYLRTSYAGTLTRQSAGYQLAANSNIDDHTAEILIARESLNSDAVIDTSTLVITNYLTDGPDLRTQFRTLYLPPATLRDINQAEFEQRANGASPGTFGWDPDAQRPTYRENTAEAHHLASKRLSQLVQAATETISRDAPEPQNDEFTQLPDTARDAAWFAPLRVAAANNLPLWCDDLATRRLATALGIRTFGTAALIDCLVEDLIDRGEIGRAMEKAERATEEFLANGVVDVPVTAEQLLVQAERDDWHPTHVALVLSRPAWWAGAAQPLSDTLAVLAVVSAKRPEASTTWQFAVMLGAARAHGDGEHAARVVAVLALLGLVERATPETLAESFRVARQVAKAASVPDPLEVLHVVRGTLDETPYARTAELVEEALRLLNGSA